MFLDDVKKRMMAAMKAGNVVEKEVLRVIVGEITTNQARGGFNTDEEQLGIVRKLMKSNEETLALAQDETQKETLKEEIAVLLSLLPKSLSVAEIVEALAPVRDAIRAAGNDGQATGVAMKHLKTRSANANGKDVQEAVKAVRAG